MRSLTPEEACHLVRSSLGLSSRGGAWLDGPLGSRSLLLPGLALGPHLEAVLAIGAFDGFHLGHRALVSSALEEAQRRGVPCLVVMFNPDPDELFMGDSAPRRLLVCEDRARMIFAAGVDGVILLGFDEGLASMEPADFVRQVLCRIAHPVSVHVGENFRFGHLGSGNCDTLRACGSAAGFEVTTHALVKRGDETVSSTRIRALLSQEDGLAEANGLLGRCHFLRGVVEHGRGEGTTFGFPTANVRFPGLSCMPAQGVYGGYVAMGSSAWPAAINVGAPPTFSGPDELFCEANLIGFSGDAYGREVCVTFAQWLRPSRPFSSLEELEQVVLGNIDWVRNHLGDGEIGLGVALDY